MDKLRVGCGVNHEICEGILKGGIIRGESIIRECWSEKEAYE